jgi:hypothetical protein
MNVESILGGLQAKAYFWPDATREFADRKLLQCGARSFLVRRSSQAHHVTLSYREDDGRVCHSLIRVEYPPMCFILVQSGERHATLDALLLCFRLVPVLRDNVPTGAALAPSPVNNSNTTAVLAVTTSSNAQSESTTPGSTLSSNVAPPKTPPDSPRNAAHQQQQPQQQQQQQQQQISSRLVPPAQGRLYVSLPTKNEKKLTPLQHPLSMSDLDLSAMPLPPLPTVPTDDAPLSSPPLTPTAMAAAAANLTLDSPCVSPRFIPEPSLPMVRLSSRMDALDAFARAPPRTPDIPPTPDELESMLRVATVGDGSAAAARRLLEGSASRAPPSDHDYGNLSLSPALPPRRNVTNLLQSLAAIDKLASGSSAAGEDEFVDEEELAVIEVHSNNDRGTTEDMFDIDAQSIDVHTLDNEIDATIARDERASTHFSELPDDEHGLLERAPTGAALAEALARGVVANNTRATSTYAAANVMLSRQSSAALTLQQRRDVTSDDLQRRFPQSTSVRVTIYDSLLETVPCELAANVPVVALLAQLTAALTAEATARPGGALAKLVPKLQHGFAIQVVHSRPTVDRQLSVQSNTSTDSLAVPRHRAQRTPLQSSFIRWLNVHLTLNMQNVAAESTLILWSHDDIRAPLSALPLAVLEGWMRVTLLHTDVVSRVHEPRPVVEASRKLYGALTNDFLFLFSGDTLNTPSVRVVNLQLYELHHRAGAPLPLVLRHLALGANAASSTRAAFDIAIEVDAASVASGGERGASTATALSAWTRALSAYCGDATRRIVLGVSPEQDYLVRVFEQESVGRVHMPPCQHRVGAAPAVLQQCVSHVVLHLTPGTIGALFSDSSRDAVIAQRMDELAQGATVPPFGSDEPTFVAARMLVRYLRLLPRPIVSAALHDEMMRAQTDADEMRAARACRAVFNAISIVPRLVLAYLLRFLSHLASLVAAASTNGPQLYDAYIEVLARLFAHCLVEPVDDLSRSSCLVGQGESTAAPCLSFLIRHWRVICSNISLEMAETVPCSCPDEAPPAIVGGSLAASSSSPNGAAAATVTPIGAIATAASTTSAAAAAAATRGDVRRGTAPANSARPTLSSTAPSLAAAAAVSRATFSAGKSGGVGNVGALALVRSCHPFIEASRMHGWLLKKRKGRSALFAPQKRYFAVCSDAVYYFSQPTAPEPLGQLTLLGSDVTRHASANVVGATSPRGDRGAAQRQFELTADGVTYVLTAASGGECDAWVTALQAVVYDSVRESRHGNKPPSIEALLALPDNAQCADCRAHLLASTAQALVGLGMFVCVPCAAAHRAVGAVQCRKALDPSWSDAQLAAMAARGNTRGALLWESTLLVRIDRGDNVRPAGAAAAHAERMDFVRAKYTEKLYYNAAQLGEDDLLPASATSAADEQTEAAQQNEVMARRKLARLSMRVVAQSKGLLNCDILWATALPPRSPVVVSAALVAALGAQLERFVGIDRLLLDALRKSVKMRDQFANHESLRAAQEFLAWSERTAELQRVPLTSSGAAAFGFAGMVLTEAEQRCFWIHVYTCMVSHLCLALFGGLRPSVADWHRALALRVYGIADVELSANDVLHGILRGGRPFGGGEPAVARSAFALPLDARVHFATPTWASDTPPMLAVVSAATVDAALTTATRTYLNEHVHLVFRRNEVSLPHVFDAYRGDFGSGSLDDVLDFVQQHLSREKSKLLNFMRQHSCNVMIRDEAEGTRVPMVLQ